MKVNEDQDLSSGSVNSPRPAQAHWMDIETAPRDGRRILCVDVDCEDVEASIRVCYPKLFPRPITSVEELEVSRPGDVWEYFRDNENAPGHTWSMVPTHWMPLPDPPDSTNQRTKGTQQETAARVAL